MARQRLRLGWLARRGLGLLVALLLATGGVVQAAHGAAAQHARALVGSCDGAHPSEALHAGTGRGASHDEGHCAQCQTFAHARVFQQPPAVLLPPAAGTTILVLPSDGGFRRDPARLAHPPRAPPLRRFSGP